MYGTLKKKKKICTLEWFFNVYVLATNIVEYLCSIGFFFFFLIIRNLGRKDLNQDSPHKREHTIQAS